MTRLGLHFRSLIALTLSAMMLVGCAMGPNLVSSKRIDASAEAQWAKLLKTTPQSSNQALTAHVRGVASEVLRAAGEDPADWQLAVFDNNEMFNAFALPNRRIGIFTGILAYTENNDQLAAVIGHEVAHVQLKHTQERLNRGVVPGAVSAVVKLPGALTDFGPLERAGDITSGAVKVGTVLPFNRSQEIEADVEGLTYVAEAGFDPAEASKFWERVAAGRANKSPWALEVFSTHPSDNRRIEALKKAAEELQESAD